MNAMEALTREVARVARMTKDYEEIGDAGKLALHMMQTSLDGACRAAGSGDAAEIVLAIKDLQGFTA